MAKSIFTSKTFWLNVLALATTLAGILPPAYGVPALAVLNVANRFLTNQPVNVFGDR